MSNLFDRTLQFPSSQKRAPNNFMQKEAVDANLHAHRASLDPQNVPTPSTSQRDTSEDVQTMDNEDEVDELESSSSSHAGLSSRTAPVSASSSLAPVSTTIKPNQTGPQPLMASWKLIQDIKKQNQVISNWKVPDSLKKPGPVRPRKAPACKNCKSNKCPGAFKGGKTRCILYCSDNAVVTPKKSLISDPEHKSGSISNDRSADIHRTPATPDLTSRDSETSSASPQDAKHATHIVTSKLSTKALVESETKFDTKDDNSLDGAGTSSSNDSDIIVTQSLVSPAASSPQKVLATTLYSKSSPSGEAGKEAVPRIVANAVGVRRSWPKDTVSKETALAAVAFPNRITKESLLAVNCLQGSQVKKTQESLAETNDGSQADNADFLDRVTSEESTLSLNEIKDKTHNKSTPHDPPEISPELTSEPRLIAAQSGATSETEADDVEMNGESLQDSSRDEEQDSSVMDADIHDERLVHFSANDLHRDERRGQPKIYDDVAELPLGPTSFVPEAVRSRQESQSQLNPSLDNAEPRQISVVEDSQRIEQPAHFRSDDNLGSSELESSTADDPKGDQDMGDESSLARQIARKATLFDKPTGYRTALSDSSDIHTAYESTQAEIPIPSTRIKRNFAVEILTRRKVVKVNRIIKRPVPVVKSSSSASSASEDDDPKSLGTLLPPLPHYSVQGCIPNSRLRPNTIYINSGVTDGSTALWPVLGTPSNSQFGWYTLVEKGHVKEEELRERLGTALGRKLKERHTGGDFWILNEMPDNYRMFLHTRNILGKTRRTWWVFGCPSKPRIGSWEILDLVPHLLWLLTCDPKKPTKCNCKWCPPKPLLPIDHRQGLSRQGSAQSFSTGPSKRTPVPSRPRSTFTLEVPPRSRMSLQKEQVEMYCGAYVDPQRDKDFLDGAIYRKGEMVWAELPKPLIDTSGETSTKLTHWPAFVLERNLKVVSHKVKSESVRSGHPPSLRSEHSWTYWVKFLACTDELTRTEDQIKAYLSYSYREDIFSSELITSPASLNLVWNRNEIRRPTLMEMKDVFQSVTAFALAMQMTSHIVASYSLTDRFPVAKDHFVSSSQISDADAMLLQLHLTDTQFQSVWWGAERIWVGELVRLLSNDAAFAVGVVRDERRCLLLKISGIFRSTDRKTAMVSGALYDLEEESKAESHHAKQRLDGSAKKAFHKSFKATHPADMPPPPPGYIFRLLTPGRQELHLDIEYVAGRYYALPPNLQSKQAIEQVLLNVSEGLGGGREMARRLALAGLLPAHLLWLKAHTWVLDRRESAIQAELNAQKDMRSYLKQKVPHVLEQWQD